MDARGVKNLSARSATDRKPYVVVVGSEPSAAEVLSELGGLVVSYRTVQDARLAGPVGPAEVAVLAGESPLATLDDALSWIRKRWPHCSSVVVGDAGDTEREVAARSGGAMYFARPVEAAEWNMLAEHALTGAAGRATRTG